MRGWQKALGLALLASGMCSTTAAADDSSPRQYYGPWEYNQSGKYHYRPYYYKSSASYVGYKHHYVVYQPEQDDKNYYFYNPYKKVYWGRCPSTHNGRFDGYSQKQYSLLPEAARKGSLRQIPESAFPPLQLAPPIPESRERVPLDLPPDDGPSLPAAPRVGAPVVGAIVRAGGPPALP